MKVGVRSLCLAALAASGLAGCALPSFGPSPQLNASLMPVDQARAADLISAYRRAHGLAGVAPDTTLEKAADAQALAMARVNVLSHTIDGDLEQRLARVGEPPRAADENVSGGYDTFASALQGWRKSPPHDRNLLDPKMRRIGVGSAYAATSRYGKYWSLILSD